MTEIKRDTKETQITLRLELRGSGKSKINSGVGFLDHMLQSLAKHAQWDLELECKGDTEVDFHHSTEDCGIALGKALNAEIFPAFNIERFSNAAVVLDEACVECVLDISNRPFLFCDLGVSGVLSGAKGAFDCELAEEFFRAVVINAALSVHIVKIRGNNNHHIIESAFKAFAVALRRALAENKNASTPSTKGCL